MLRKFNKKRTVAEAAQAVMDGSDIISVQSKRRCAKKAAIVARATAREDDEQQDEEEEQNC